MAYVKPGVEVKQVQTSASPTLTTPSLSSVIIGQGFLVVEQSDVEYSTVYNNAEDTSLTLSGMGSHSTESDSTYISLYSLDHGGYKHLKYGTNLDDADCDFTVTNNEVTIASGLGDELQGASIYAGFRASRDDLEELLTIGSLDDIETRIGKPTIDNPLGFGISTALSNSAGNQVYAWGVDADDAASHTDAQNDLALHEVYAMAPMTQQDVSSNYSSHVNGMSTPENKKERIVFVNKPISWAKTDGSTATGPGDASMDKAGTARKMRDSAYAQMDKRSFWINPDTVYVSANRPVATLEASYMQNTI